MLRALVLLAALAAATADVCGKESRQLHWEGECDPSESDEFVQGSSTCSCKDGKPHGKGQMRDAGISIFRGVYKEGLRHGVGVHVFKNGMIFKGDYVHDKWEGTGTLSMESGGYAGDFKGGMPEGLGAMIDSRQQQYAGEYLSGKKHGFGMFEYMGGHSYIGEWVQDKRTGCGEYTTAYAHLQLGYLLGTTKKTGKWRPCTTAHCTVDFWCDCMTDGSSLVNIPPTPEDIKCAEAAIEKAHQLHVLGLEAAEKAKLDYAHLSLPSAADFGEVSDEAVLKKPTIVEEELTGAAENILGDWTSMYVIMGITMIVSGIVPAQYHTRIWIATGMCVILMLMEYYGWAKSIEWSSRGYVSRYTVDAYLQKLPSIMRPPKVLHEEL